MNSQQPGIVSCFLSHRLQRVPPFSRGRLRNFNLEYEPSDEEARSSACLVLSRMRGGGWPEVTHPGPRNGTQSQDRGGFQKARVAHPGRMEGDTASFCSGDPQYWRGRGPTGRRQRRVSFLQALGEPFGVSSWSRRHGHPVTRHLWADARGKL